MFNQISSMMEMITENDAPNDVGIVSAHCLRRYEELVCRKAPKSWAQKIYFVILGVSS